MHVGSSALDKIVFSSSPYFFRILLLIHSSFSFLAIKNSIYIFNINVRVYAAFLVVCISNAINVCLTNIQDKSKFEKLVSLLLSLFFSITFYSEEALSNSLSHVGRQNIRLASRELLAGLCWL